jgi:hypothetical protein
MASIIPAGGCASWKNRPVFIKYDLSTSARPISSASPIVNRIILLSCIHVPVPPRNHIRLLVWVKGIGPFRNPTLVFIDAVPPS